ncbi:uncharacterized protein LOC128558015 [Mercenaria mercenaria]|uniref:uncharacterized protein LOC128558015 n=1 Tax=Mercenaria mercenaria TaxID=6596 RepID=UPI00234EAE25|nr:uncharacterized protein LOC128558015 [Mercenaria mercenaria]
MSGSENRKSGRPTTRHDYGKVNEIGFGDDDTGNPSENSDNQDGATAIFSPVKNKKDETLALLQSQLQSLDQEEEEIEQKKKSVADLRGENKNFNSVEDSKISLKDLRNDKKLRSEASKKLKETGLVSESNSESDISSEDSGSESDKQDSEKVSKEKKSKKNKKKSKKSSSKNKHYEDDSSSDETSSSDSSSSKESKRKHKKT